MEKFLGVYRSEKTGKLGILVKMTKTNCKDQEFYKLQICQGEISAYMKDGQVSTNLPQEDTWIEIEKGTELDA